MPEIPELPLQYVDDVIYWATKAFNREEQPKPVAPPTITPTKKAKKLLEKKSGVLGLADDAAVLGSRLLNKQNPLKQKNNQQKPDEIRPILKQAEYAPGIPSKTIKDLPRISEPQPMRLAIQKHQAKRAGLHYDVRIVDDKTGKAYSWAVRNLPTFPGDKVLAKLQPTHTASYSTWSGVIPEGYGAGTVNLFSQDKIEVIKAEHEKISFNVYKSNGDTERYVMINTGGDNWLFHNVTPTRTTRPMLPAEKPHYKGINPETLDPTKPNEVWAPKIDGALNVFLLRPDKPIETYSYRPSVKGANKLIDHTFRMGLHKTTVPTAFKGNTVVLGEAFARDRSTGKVLSSTDTSARLLSNVWRSRELQERAPLDNIIFNVLRYNGRDVSKKPYGEKLNILKQISMAVPQLKMPPLSYTEEGKTELMKEVKSGTHPLSEEGIVVYKLDQDTPLKAKIQQDYDVYIRGVFPGEGKHKGKAAGGFTYSFKSKGPVIGKVGTGLSDLMRKNLWENPQEYTGSLARIFAQQQLPSGALRMPVFKDIRSEKFASKHKNDVAHAIERAKERHNLILTSGHIKKLSDDIAGGRAKHIRTIDEASSEFEVTHGHKILPVVYNKIKHVITTVLPPKTITSTLKDIAKFRKLSFLQKYAYPPAAEPPMGKPSATNLHEIGKTQGEDTIDFLTKHFLQYEPDGTRPASVSSASTDFMKRRRAEYIKKRADYTIGIPTAAAPSNVPNPLGIGGTGGGAEQILSETPHMQGVHEDLSAYRITDFSNAENPASMTNAALTPIFDRLKAAREKAKIRGMRRA